MLHSLLLHQLATGTQRECHPRDSPNPTKYLGNNHIAHYSMPTCFNSNNSYARDAHSEYITALG